jgi:ubiquinone biosynthesis protein COQ4
MRRLASSGERLTRGERFALRASGDVVRLRGPGDFLAFFVRGDRSCAISSERSADPVGRLDKSAASFIVTPDNRRSLMLPNAAAKKRAPERSSLESERSRRPSERAAAAAAIHGTPLERARLAAESLRDLLRDPEDTSRVFVLGLVMNLRKYPEFLARLTFDDRGARLLRERPAIDTKHVDFDRLRSLPADTLGGAYVRLLDANGLDPDLFQSPPGLPEVPAYIAQRMRQVHDIWHVLTGYGTDRAGELALQAFTYANVGAPSAGMIALGGLLRYGPTHPRYFGLVLDGFRRGRKAAFLPPIWLEEMWERPLVEVQRELGLTPRGATSSSAARAA